FVVSCSGIRIGFERESVMVFWLVLANRLMNNFSVRIGDFEFYRMRMREFDGFVVEDERQVNHIARTPNTALSVDVAFQSLLKRFATRHVEVTQRLRESV